MHGSLVGRVTELEWLEAFLAPAKPERGLIGLICGEAGIGKSRLLDAATSVSPRLWVSFSNRRLTEPALGLSRLAALSGEAGEPLSHVLDPGNQDPTSAEIYEAADHLLRQLGPVPVIFDDGQWMDELTLGWLAHLSEVSERTPFRIVMSVRTVGGLTEALSVALHPNGRLGLVQRLDLGPVTDEAVRQLAAQYLTSLSPAGVAALCRRSDGVPLLVHELLRASASQEAGGNEPSDPYPLAASLPVVEGIIREQLAELDAASKNLLALAALAPTPLDEILLRKAANLAEGFDECLDRLLTVGLLQLGMAGLEFRHELHRETLQGLQSVARRRARHRSLAEGMSMLGGSAAAIADQFLSAGHPDEALKWLIRATGEAMRAHDPGAALGFIESAFGEGGAVADLDTSIDLACDAATAARLCGHTRRARRLVDLVLTKPMGPVDRGRLLTAAASLATYEGNFTERFDLLSDACAAYAEGGDVRNEGVTLCRIAMEPVAGRLGPEDCIRLGKQGVELVRRSGDEITLARSLGQYAYALLSCGETRGFSCFDEAASLTRISQRSDMRVVATANAHNEAVMAIAYGDYMKAEQALAPARHGVFKEQSREFLAVMRSMLLWRTGKWSEALSELRSSDLGAVFPELRALAKVVESSITFERENRPRVRDLEEAVKRLIDHADTIWAAVGFATLLRVRAARREPHPDRGLERMADLLKSSWKLVGWDDLLLSLARQSPRMYRRFSDVMGDLVPKGPRAQASMLLSLGYLDFSERNNERAMEVSLKAATAFEALGEPASEAVALELASDAAVACGQRVGALRARAAQLYADIGAERSLALLLRKAGDSRSLRSFHIPNSQVHSTSPGLTPREHDVARLAAQGLTTQAIADELAISFFTAKSHLTRVKSKLGAGTKSELVRLLQND